MSFKDFLDYDPGATQSAGALGGPKARSPRAQDWELRTGPEWTAGYEPQVGTIPISGANLEVRNFSPFTLRVLPPLIYLANPAWLTGTEANQIDPVTGKPVAIQLGLVGNAGVGNLANFEKSLSEAKKTKGVGHQTNAGGASPPPVVTGGYLTKKPVGGAAGGTNTAVASKPAITDMVVARDIANQLERILKVPPLTLFINPTSFQVQYTKIQQYSERTRFGLIRQEWGEDLPKLSISGRIGAYLTGSPEMSDSWSMDLLNGGSSGPGVSAGMPKGSVPGQGARNRGTGVQFANKRDSAAWQQLMALFTFYKNNGYIYDNITASNAHHLVGCLAIDYDNWTYVGNMDTFSWAYQEAQQGGGVEFQIGFTAIQMYDKHDASKSKAIKPLKGPIPNQWDDRHDGISAQNFKDAIGKSDRTATIYEHGKRVDEYFSEDDTGDAEINTQVVEEDLGEPTPIDPANPPDEDEIKPSAEGFATPPVSTPMDMGSVPIEPYFRWQ